MFDWQQKLRNPDFPFFTFLWCPFTPGAPCDIPCGTGDILHFGWSPMPAARLPSACVLGANPSYCQVLFTCQPVPLGHLFSQLPVSLRLHVSTSSPKFGWNQPPSSSAVWLPFPFRSLSKMDRQCNCISSVSFGNKTENGNLCRVACRYVMMMGNKKDSVWDKSNSIWQGWN